MKNCDRSAVSIELPRYSRTMRVRLSGAALLSPSEDMSSKKTKCFGWIMQLDESQREFLPGFTAFYLQRAKSLCAGVGTPQLSRSGMNDVEDYPPFH